MRDAQALKPRRGQRTTKLPALNDGQGRPPALLLNPGQAANRRVAKAL